MNKNGMTAINHHYQIWTLTTMKIKYKAQTYMKKLMVLLIKHLILTILIDANFKFMCRFAKNTLLGYWNTEILSSGLRSLRKKIK